MSEITHNWAGHIRYGATRLHRPASQPELQEIVARSRKVKAFGTRHSFNAITDSPEDQISLERMAQNVDFDESSGQVTISGGMSYSQLGPALHRIGRAVHNIASFAHFSVAGAVSTATHGSGDRNGNLATAVTGLEIVRADGELVTLSREKDGERFAGAVVGLGALGVIHRLTLETQPAFLMQQEIYENVPVSRIENQLDDLMSAAYSVSLFTDWQGDINQVWLKHRLTDGTPRPIPPTFLGGTLAAHPLHPVAAFPPDKLSPQMGIPGLWYDRMPHFEIDTNPAGGNELQTEYFVDRRHAPAALMVVASLGKRLAGVLKISEVRSMAGDDLWLSMAYGRDTVGIHFSWWNDWAAVSPLLDLIETELAPFAPRPHWGKLFNLPGSYVQAQYPRMNDFRVQAESFDPTGKFRNDFLNRNVFA